MKKVGLLAILMLGITPVFSARAALIWENMQAEHWVIDHAGVHSFWVTQEQGIHSWEFPSEWTLIAGGGIGDNFIQVSIPSEASGVINWTCYLNPNVSYESLNNEVTVRCFGSDVVATDDIDDRMVTGDFDGDGVKNDVAVLYSNSSSSSGILVWKGGTSGDLAYEGSSGWWQSSSYYDAELTTGRVVAGDFDGDGNDDIAALYDYGSGQTRIHVWKSTGSSFVYQSSAGWWSATGYTAGRTTGRVVSGDFNNDGKDDVAAMYKYNDVGGLTQARIHVWLSTGGSFTYQSSNGWWNNINGGGYDAYQVSYRMVSGQFDGVYGDDIAVMYKYPDVGGQDHARIHVFTANSTGNAFTLNGGTAGWWSRNSYDAIMVTNRMAVGDFNQDGKDDIAAMYKYPDAGGYTQARIHVWQSTGSSLSYQYDAGWWSNSGWGYDANLVTGRFKIGDFNNDNAPDVVAMYDYGYDRSRLHVWTGEKNFIMPPGAYVFGGAFNWTTQYGWWAGCPSSYPLVEPVEQEEINKPENVTAGTEDLPTAELGMSLYPNPTKGNFTVEVAGSSISSVVVRNLVGQEVHTQMASSSRATLDMSGHEAGVYLVQVKLADQSQRTMRLVVAE